ncbi:MAG: hypothetical protein KGL39_35425 [Patescibacteria group bacterium]|nr:hypothetical protein [Patescibacteria group bacterium]
MTINTRLAALTARFLLCPEECFALRDQFAIRAKLSVKTGSNVESTLRWAARYNREDIWCRFKHLDIPLDCCYGMTVLAAKHGHMRPLRWIKDIGVKLDQSLVSIAAKYGHLTLLKWLRLHGLPVDQSVHETAASNGHYRIVAWLASKGFTPTQYLKYLASASGHVHFLEWWYDNVDQCIQPYTATLAVSKEYINILEWLRSKGYTYWDQLCHCADGNPTSLQWLKDNGYCSCGGIHH